jgi:uncharacterized protein (DUF1684 family)
MCRFFILFFYCFFFVSASAQSTYHEEIRNWDSSRVAYLKSENGWLNLAGLFWLSEGRNSFGSDEKNKIVFRGPGVPARAGYFDLIKGVVTMLTEPGSGITIDGKVRSKAVIYHPDSTRLPNSALASFRWTIKKSEDRYGIRLRDLEHPAVKEFSGLERFPVDTNWRVRAYLQKYSGGVDITNVLGQTIKLESPGKLIFTLKDKQYSLDAVWEGEQLYIIFGDVTSGVTTYASGRYIYARQPGPDGFTILDFNKAFNPPCAFTDFATCPIPPKQNWLSVAVTAGEKNFGH